MKSEYVAGNELKRILECLQLALSMVKNQTLKQATLTVQLVKQAPNKIIECCSVVAVEVGFTRVAYF